jgi:cytochrome c553
MDRILLAGVGFAAWLGVLGVAAGDVLAGKAKTGACAACHGRDGAGVGANPPLAGESEEQIVRALGDFKSGRRANPAMKAMASMLSDQDMANIGAYYASLKR